MSHLEPNEMKDPRGVRRTIQAVEMRTDVALVTLSCGHIGRFNQIFTYRIGEPSYCFACRHTEENRRSI